jgi:hypothetical protein
MSGAKKTKEDRESRIPRVTVTPRSRRSGVQVQRKETVRCARTSRARSCPSPGPSPRAITTTGAANASHPTDGEVGRAGEASWYCAKKIKVCPHTFAEASSPANAGDCAMGSVEACTYPHDGGCHCAMPETGVRWDPRLLSWKCDAAPLGCPYPPPVAGSPCSKAGQECHYNNASARCERGRWEVMRSLPPP